MSPDSWQMRLATGSCFASVTAALLSLATGVPIRIRIFSILLAIPCCFVVSQGVGFDIWRIAALLWSAYSLAVTASATKGANSRAGGQARIWEVSVLTFIPLAIWMLRTFEAIFNPGGNGYNPFFAVLTFQSCAQEDVRTITAFMIPCLIGV